MSQFVRVRVGVGAAISEVAMELGEERRAQTLLQRLARMGIASELGPGGTTVVGTLVGRLGQQLKIDEALTTVTNAGCDTVGAGIAAADDNHMFVFGGDIGFVADPISYEESF